MAHGFDVLGTHGSTLVNESYANFALVSKGTANADQATAWTSVKTCTLSFWGRSCPMLAVRHMEEGVQMLMRPTRNASDNSRWDFYIYCYTDHGWFEWYLFDNNVPVPATSRYGVAVYKADGSPAWHSDWKVARVASTVSIPNWYQDSNSYDVYDPPEVSLWLPNTSRKYAVYAPFTRTGKPEGDTTWYTDALIRYWDRFAISPYGAIIINFGDEDGRVSCPVGGTGLLFDVTDY